jgi:two-component system phosphate regulon sensor histidine kinase PhoR
LIAHREERGLTAEGDELERPDGEPETAADVSESGKTREELLAALDAARMRVRELERQLSEFADLEGPSGGPRAVLQGTLTRVLKKACMILQAEKSVLLIYNRESGELVAQVPAVGLTEDQLHSLKLRATEGIAGEVFRTNESRIIADIHDEPAGANEFPMLIGWRNALVIPLVVESKDRDQVVVDRTTIGVMTVFNKRRGKGFSADDLRLSRVLARNAAAIIAEAKLFSDVLEQKQMIEKSLESLHSGIMMVSGDGTVRLMNKAARQLFVLGPTTEPVGRDYVEVVSHPDGVDAMSRSLSEQRDIDREMTFDDDRRFFQVQTAVVRDGETMSGIVAIFTDITEIRNLERLKATFVTTISHELGTPLAAILGFTRTMLDDGEGFFSPDVRTEFLQIIEKECTKLHRLVNDLRNMARIEEKGTLELHAGRMDIADLVRGVVAAQRSYATHHTFRIEMTTEFEEAPLVADKDKVDQILTNLVNNAVKYSPSGGEVLIRGEKTPAGVSIAITDQGIGIPEDQIERIFERFHKVDTEQSGRPDGAGIGLYIVRHLVELHGGAIGAESTFGEGSTFTVELPLVPHRPEEPLRGPGLGR